MEWIEHPLLMLKVRGLNPSYSISKNTTSLPETKWLFGANFGAYPVLRVTPVFRPKKLDYKVQTKKSRIHILTNLKPAIQAGGNLICSA